MKANYSRQVILVMLVTLMCAGIGSKLHAQGRADVTVQCVALDTTRPRHFISYERIDHEAWDGKRHVKGAVLRLTNNSKCSMLLLTPPGIAPRFIKKNGKYISQNDYDTPQLKNNSHVELTYKLHFPQTNRVETPIPIGDVILKSKLASGESVVFSVPVKFLKRRAEIELPFNYELDTKPQSIRFAATQLPKIALK